MLLIPFGIWQLSNNKSYIGGSQVYNNVWNVACFGLAMIGSAIRFVSIGYAQSGTSGRNTSAGQVADALNTKGMYSLVRHPLYIGNILIYTAALLFTKSLWFALAGCLGLVLYYERIIATEENYLRAKFGDSIKEWADRTPCWFPKFSNWVTPSINFSVKAGLRSEIYSVAGIVVAFYVLDMVEHYFVEGVFRADPIWSILLAVSVVTFFLLRFLRKKTTVLDTESRRVET